MSKKKYKKKAMTELSKSRREKIYYAKDGRPAMKITNQDGKSDTTYAGGTMYTTNKLTGEKSKKRTMWMKRISAEEFDGKPKIKLRKKSAGYKKVVRK